MEFFLQIHTRVRTHDEELRRSNREVRETRGVDCRLVAFRARCVRACACACVSSCVRAMLDLIDLVAESADEARGS